jgi:hypothetical protein
MTKTLLALALSISLLCSSCSTTSTFWQSQSVTWLKQAFGNYVRSLEGQGLIDQIPSLIMAAREKWLPAGHDWDVFVADLIHKYVVANPNNHAEVNRVLEQLATELQK